MGIVSERMPRCLLEQRDLAEEEPERIDPGEKDA
jgi:hypothetical protein